ncbi:MAG: hypothetical protein LBU64_01340 [Planctomycetota bacterium]|jgi:hypothetical protein|nr:hypothetical protein [Planctomycetota bacterium]
MNLPDKCLVDTNVAKTANLATRPDSDSDTPPTCILACVEAIEHVIKKRGLVLDAGDEIFSEYRRQLSLRGQPGVGDRFVKWVHDHRWGLAASQLVAITRDDDSYAEFPLHPGLGNFDKSDRKFVAVANAHPDKPPILQATDSKWWGWRGALAEVGLAVHFLCLEYAKGKYVRKIGT